MMDNNDFERRKNTRRQHRKSKNIDKGYKYVDDYHDEYKIKKQFKKHKQELLEEELWEEWQNEDD
jgi:hypothetical protein